MPRSQEELTALAQNIAPITNKILTLLSRASDGRVPLARLTINNLFQSNSLLIQDIDNKMEKKDFDDLDFLFTSILSDVKAFKGGERAQILRKDFKSTNSNNFFVIKEEDVHLFANYDKHKKIFSTAIGRALDAFVDAIEFTDAEPKALKKSSPADKKTGTSEYDGGSSEESEQYSPSPRGVKKTSNQAMRKTHSQEPVRQ